ncbi:MAG TPA: AAA family ATPase, partial [Acidobacteriaceae bacterium]|nr:AAA family ATPase [Acidobacteriaceae bacterium]
MRLIFIYGKPATGKLTVAKELAAITGYKLFHNHLAVDLLLSVFEFGSAPFVELREQIWLSVFEQASRSGLEGLIFTFAPEVTVRANFPTEAQATVEREGGKVRFVELVCPMAELKRRIDTPSRREYQKLTSVELFER